MSPLLTSVLLELSASTAGSAQARERLSLHHSCQASWRRSVISGQSCLTAVSKYKSEDREEDKGGAEIINAGDMHSAERLQISTSNAQASADSEEHPWSTPSVEHQQLAAPGAVAALDAGAELAKDKALLAYLREQSQCALRA
jgi:hypothetical protein